MQYFDKINTCFKRDMDKASKTYNCIIPDQLTTPEFEMLRKYNVKWEATEKVDGECTSIHLIPKSEDSEVMPGQWEEVSYYDVEVHGKTDKANMRPDEVDLLKKIGDRDKLLEAFTRIKEDGTREEPEMECIIFGETYGKGMQAPGGRYCKDHLKFICFDIKIGGTWLKRDAVEEICSKLGIEVVPDLGEMSLDEAIEKVKKGFTSQVSEDPTLIAEGIVLRAPLGILDRMGRRIITKVKYKDFQDLKNKIGYEI
jgi:hypothetical protein